METRNRCWTDEELFAERKTVLARWPTGAEVDLDEAIEYARKLPPEKTYPGRLAKARKDGQILIALRIGKPRIEDMFTELKTLVPYSDFFEVDVDTYTRKGLYQKAQEALDRTYKAGENLLNAYPYVAYGVKNTRKLMELSHAPLFSASNDEDSRLQDEIAMASGFSGYITHDVREVLSHSKNYPLDKRIRNNQYCCRLAAHYTQHGVPICMCCIGSNLPFCPPGMGIALVILEALTAAEQGVKHIIVGHDQRGELVQDVAAMRTIARMARQYVDRFGHKGVTLYNRSGPGAFAWPRDKDASGAQVALCTVTAVLGGNDLIRTKSIDEGRGTPSLESQIPAGKIARHVINVLGRSHFNNSDEMVEEERMQELEAAAIVEKVIELGDGDTVVGEMKAIEQGVIDVPFSPWINVRGWVMPVRDGMGRVRYLDPGHVPLPKEVVDYHRRKIADREKKEDRQAGIEMLIEDLGFRTRSVA